MELLTTKGFAAPTLAFVGSIGVTNAVSAFTSETMHRAGFMRETVIDGLGAGFQVAVMVGGVVLGGFVDRHVLEDVACGGAALGWRVEGGGRRA